MSPPVFTCVNCGKQYPALPPDPPTGTPEQCAQLKQAWYSADDYLNAHASEMSKEEYDKQDAKVHARSAAYLAACGQNTTWQLPKEITTNKAHQFVCADGCTHQ